MDKYLMLFRLVMGDNLFILLLIVLVGLLMILRGMIDLTNTNKRRKDTWDADDYDAENSG